ncbi:MAG: hypothetical protein LUC87_01600 [Clostridiales bacterium]|nr:hypothetical protein [Clostridiales bacterium]MCD8368625.1 hypothetical protein [Clostridiales bacterium]
MKHTSQRPDVHHSGQDARLLAYYIPLILDPEAARLADRRKAALAGYLRQELTERELDCLRLYFVEGLSLEAISRLLHVARSTISRNIARGRARIDRVLCLGGELLGQDFIRG